MVTGPDGFVGTGLCAALTSRNHFVRGAQWAAGPLAPGCEAVVVGDIGRKTDWSAALDGVSVVIHLAARVHTMRDRAEDPLEEFRKVNVAGATCLAEAASKAGVRRFILMSSIKVNGGGGRRTSDAGRQTGTRPYTEDDQPCPEDAYAISKWEAEQALREIERGSDMAVTILRPPLIYGPGVGANFLQLVKLIAKGYPLPFGAIRNRRSLLGLSNLTDLIVRIVERSSPVSGTFLVSDGEDLSSADLVRRIARALGRRPRVLSVPESLIRLGAGVTGGVSQASRLLGSLQIDSSRVRRILGWQPPCSVDEELRRVADWYTSTVA